MERAGALTGLDRFLAPQQYVMSRAALVTYEIDAGLDKGDPQAVVFPQTTEQVAEVVKWAIENHFALIARGAGTGLSGGAVAEQGGVIVEFSRLNRLLELDIKGKSAVVEPGILNLSLDDTAKKQGLYYPPDPASQRASTIGGNTGENAGGPHCFKYGVTTNYVMGLYAVLPDGRAVHVGGRAYDYPGYDVTGLIVGGEGTLAIMTAAELRLVRNPPGVKTMMAVFSSLEQAGQAVSAVIAAGLVPATMEMMDHHIARIIEEYAHPGLPMDAEAILIIEADGYPASLDTQVEEVADILEANGGREIRIAQSAEERERIWFARKSAAGAFSRFAPAYYLVDITVPRSRLAETLGEVNQICEKYGVHAGHVFHAGDGNLHPLIAIMHPEDPQQVQNAQRAGKEMVKLGVSKDGSLTGEHGVGIEKREYMSMMYTGAELSAMLDVKQTFDPHNRFNPGKVLPAKLPEVARATPLSIVPEGTFAPTTTEQAAQAIVALANARRAVYINHALERSEAVPGVRLTTGGLSGIKTYAPDDLYVTAGAGTRLEEIQEMLARDGRQVPLASPWSGATIGGLVSSNLNAPLRMRYGGLRDLVLAMTVVLSDGRIIRAGRPVVKNVAGYDMPKVFVGSFGTLGLITDVTLKLTPLPRARRTVFISAGNLEGALEVAQDLASVALVCSALLVVENSRIHQLAPNLDGKYVIVYSAEGIREDVDAELNQVKQVLDKRGFSFAAEAQSSSGTEIWQQALGTALDEFLVRAAVAPKDIGEYVRRQNGVLETATAVVDVANGMVYAAAGTEHTTAARAWLDALRMPANELGGYAVVLSAPESIRGALDLWGYAPDTLDVMRGLKARWDPAGILNPGVFIV